MTLGYKMNDAMLTELYKRVFETKKEAELLSSRSDDPNNDRLRQVAIEKNSLLSELIGIRTEQIMNGEHVPMAVE